MDLEKFKKLKRSKNTGKALFVYLNDEEEQLKQDLIKEGFLVQDIFRAFLRAFHTENIKKEKGEE